MDELDVKSLGGVRRRITAGIVASAVLGVVAFLVPSGLPSDIAHTSLIAWLQFLVIWVLYTTGCSRLVKWLTFMAAFSFSVAQFLDISENFAVIENLPILGRHSGLNGGVNTLSYVMGIILLFCSILFAVAEAAQGRLLLAAKNRRLEENTEELRKAQEKLTAYRDQLEEIVESRTRELKSSLVELESANKTKGRFLASMSHELRTPMNSVLGFAELLKSGVYGDLTDKQDAYVGHILTSGRHLLELLNELLDMAKIDAGAIELNLEDVPVAEAVQNALMTMGAQFENKGIHARAEGVPREWRVRADPRRLQQVLLNLLSNAAKYTPEGGDVCVDANRAVDGFVTFTVRDNGIGISPEHHQRIFSEFEQAEQSRDEALGGIGLGLALSRRLVQIMDGEIGVKSDVGKGSTFWFTVPGAKGRARAIVDVESWKALSIPPSRILVAEDDAANLVLIRDVLLAQGHEVHEARNGKEAVDLALAEKPDLILMDVQMPVMNGLDASRTIRQNPSTADIPIVAFTASIDAEREQDCLHAGCVRVLGKPIDINLLNATLEELLIGA